MTKGKQSDGEMEMCRQCCASIRYHCIFATATNQSGQTPLLLANDKLNESHHSIAFHSLAFHSKAMNTALPLAYQKPQPQLVQSNMTVAMLSSNRVHSGQGGQVFWATHRNPLYEVQCDSHGCHSAIVKEERDWQNQHGVPAPVARLKCPHSNT